MSKTIKNFWTICILAMCPFAVFAFDNGDISYEKDGTNAIVIGYKNEKSSYIIPSYVEYNGENLRVNAIGKKAFYDNSKIVKIDLPNTLETIGEQAFYNCGNLAIISLPDAVTLIGVNAFSLCSNLKKIEISPSSSLTTIGRSAFSYCGIESIFIPQKVESIAKSAFANCAYLSAMSVDDNNTVYDSRNGCNAIIQKQGNVLVFGCCNTIIPNDIIIIGENAFYGSNFGDGLGKVTLPGSLTTISGSAFYNCKISSIVIPDAVESIGDNAFSLCSELEKVEFSSSSSLLSIGRSVFSYCEVLDDITIPKSVLTIEKNVFANCKSLSRIQVEAGNVFYSSPNNCNAILQGGKLIVGCSGTDIFKSGAVSIGEGAFYGSEFGGDIVIPSSIKTIEEQGFYSCDKLTSVSVEDGLTTIGRYAFSLCFNLEKVQLPSSLKSIDKYAFHYCDNIREITSLIRYPFAVDNSVFDGLFTTAKLLVPTGTKTIYQLTSGWNFSTIEEFDPPSTSIAGLTVTALRVRSNNGVIYIESATSGNCNIYTVNGQLMRKVSLKQGMNTVEDLPKGIYIMNGQKIRVK